MPIDTERVLQELLQKVSKIEAKLDAALTNNAERQSSNEKRIEDHELRLRSIEAMKDDIRANTKNAADHEKRIRFLEKIALYVIGGAGLLFIIFEIYRTFVK